MTSWILRSAMRAGASPNAKEVSQLSRTHGLQWPLHPLQGLAWLILLILAILFFCVTVSGLPYPWQPAAYITQGICLFMLALCFLVASIVNPADDNVLRKTKCTVKARFDRNVHKHVIENLYCNICLVDVGSKSKHCGECNKCVSDFDHHCKWLNNCVGGKNYKWFVATLSTGLVCCLINVSLCTMQFVAYFTDKQDGFILQQYSTYHHFNYNTTTSDGATFQILYSDVPHEAWLAVTAIEALLSFVIVVMLAHLLIFHMYLKCKGMSTYDYIIMDRTMEERENADGDIHLQQYPQKKQEHQNEGNAKASSACWQKRSVAPISKTTLEATTDLEAGS